MLAAVARTLMAGSPTRPRTVPLVQADARRVLLRAIRLRCPRCGGSPLYERGFRMHEACLRCAMRYEREAGYFVGAIYVNYAFTVAVAAGAVLLLDWRIGLTLAQQLAVGIVLAVLIPLAFFRHARSLWLCIGYLATRADERWERQRWQRQ